MDVKTDRADVCHLGGDHGPLSDFERDQRAGEGEGAADQGGPQDDGAYGRGAHGLVGLPLRLYLLLHFRAHGAFIGVRFREQVCMVSVRAMKAACR